MKLLKEAYSMKKFKEIMDQELEARIKHAKINRDSESTSYTHIEGRISDFYNAIPALNNPLIDYTQKTMSLTFEISKEEVSVTGSFKLSDDYMGLDLPQYIPFDLDLEEVKSLSRRIWDTRESQVLDKIRSEGIETHLSLWQTWHSNTWADTYARFSFMVNRTDDIKSVLDEAFRNINKIIEITLAMKGAPSSAQELIDSYIKN